MKVLIVGSGGREHALVWKMSQSEQVSQVFAAPGNGGMKKHAELVSLKTHEEILNFVKERQIDLTVIGPEIPLVEGLVDKLDTAGVKSFGPTAAAAALEGSKAFAKDFMKRHQIPTSASETFTEVQPALDYLQTLPAPYVIKADGLAAGKGVLICDSLEKAQASVKDMLENKTFGEASNKIVIEEFMQGEEASCFAITDGKDFILFPSCQDHKRIGELDTGLNTGGMGAYTPAPVVTPEMEQKIIEQIVKPTINGMSKEGHPYKGVLYIGLMIIDGQPRVVEYNCRFGDPECQPLMMKLKSDLFPLLMAVSDGTLARQKPEWNEESVACIVLASEGYPGSYEKGRIISGIDAQSEDSSPWSVFHAGTCLDGSVYRTNGGRVLGVTAMGKTLEMALDEAYKAVRRIHWDGMNYRRDIGLKGLRHYKDNRPKTSVSIMIGSKSDLDVAKKATAILERFGVGYELNITSAHRSPERTRQIIHDAEAKGVEVFIAMAGMAAHLPGVIAADTAKPVIGVPIEAKMQGMDALLAIAQMPPGIPVAAMATNGAMNAAILAVQILSLRYTDLRAQLKLYKIEMAQKVVESHKSAGLEVTS